MTVSPSKRVLKNFGVVLRGRGIAAILNLALERMGKHDHALYDGSWAEWGAFSTLPVKTGDA